MVTRWLGLEVGTEASDWLPSGCRAEVEMRVKDVATHAITTTDCSNSGPNSKRGELTVDVVYMPWRFEEMLALYNCSPRCTVRNALGDGYFGVIACKSFRLVYVNG